jgi:hypothetical protein
MTEHYLGAKATTAVGPVLVPWGWDSGDTTELFTGRNQSSALDIKGGSSWPSSSATHLVLDKLPNVAIAAPEGLGIAGTIVSGTVPPLFQCSHCLLRDINSKERAWNVKVDAVG